jgi:hypothetical protein
LSPLRLPVPPSRLIEGKQQQLKLYFCLAVIGPALSK